MYVASDVAYRTQAEVDGAAAAIAEQIAGAFAEFEGVARGNPKLHAGAAISIDNVGAPFDGKYTITTSHHRYDPITGYTTSFSVTGRQERSLYGLTSGGGGARTGQGPVIAQVSDANDPQQQARVKLTFPWLSDTYVSDWARTVQPGAGKDRGAMVLPEVGDEVLVVFEQGDIRRPYVLGGLYNGIDTPPTGGPTLIDGSSGAINRRSMVSRRGHRIDLIDEDGRTEGITLSTTGDKLQLKMDSVDTKITVHSDGKILIEGKGGIVIDSASSKLELKGSEVSIAATSGVKIDGGSGCGRRLHQRPAVAEGHHRQAGGQRVDRRQGQRRADRSGHPRQDQLELVQEQQKGVGRMPPAARVGDPTGHPGVIGPPGVPTVLIAGMPAATVGTPHICSFPPPAVHPPTAIAPPGCPTVLIGGMPAARMGDMSLCGAPIVVGAPTVLIGG